MTQNDLFEGAPLFGQGGAKVAQGGACATLGPTSSGGAVAHPRKWREGGATAYMPPDLGAGRANARETKKEKKETALREQLKALYLDLEMVNARVSEAMEVASPYAAEFRYADRQLRQLRQAVAVREAKREKYKIFEYYDARVREGHEWCPHRRRLDEAMRWNKELGT